MNNNNQSIRTIFHRKIFDGSRLNKGSTVWLYGSLDDLIHRSNRYIIHFKINEIILYCIMKFVGMMSIHLDIFCWHLSQI